LFSFCKKSNKIIFLSIFKHFYNCKSFH
jgi:hypothetical protein